jgi:hypothetical protein
MVRATTVLTVLLFIEGCAFAPKFTPTTMRGAECKRECAMGRQACRANPYTCDNGYSGCIEACIDIDRLSKQKKSE